MTEQELVAGCRAGRREAFDEMVSRYYDRIHRLGYALVGPESAHDLAQETFLAAVRGLPNFRGESRISTWLISILRNQASLLRRSEKKRRTAPLNDEGERLTAPQPKELEAGLKTILERLKDLPEDLRLTLILFYVEGIKYAEIAQVMGCPIGTVRSRLFEARERLKAFVTEKET
jgi:RNA polymerase sigma-70 factor (ECF subfamily)